MASTTNREGHGMATSSSINEAATGLASTFSGQLIEPGALGYDEARKVHNGIVDKRPALIARCLGVADVVDAVLLARNLGLEVAVRGGAHNVVERQSVFAHEPAETA